MIIKSIIVIVIHYSLVNFYLSQIYSRSFAKEEDEHELVDRASSVGSNEDPPLYVEEVSPKSTGCRCFK